jgi:hypothetical protein
LVVKERKVVRKREWGEDDEKNNIRAPVEPTDGQG